MTTLGGAPAGDIDGMLKNAGVPVEIGGVCGWGIAKEGDVDGVQVTEHHTVSGLIGAEVVLTVRTGAFPALAPEAAVTVDGEDYVAIQTRKQRNGTTRVYLREA